jgi:uncharacterized coiled-coil protein SlyX
MPTNGLKLILPSMVLGSMLYAAPAAAQSSPTIAPAELRQIIARQQQRISAQSKQLDALARRLDAFIAASSRQKPASKAAGSAKPIAASKTAPKRVSLAISGQVNRAVLYAEDGNSGELFHVDNDHSSTRLRLVGTGRVSKDISLGAKIEVQMESNSTASVSQDDNENGIGGASFTERKLEVWVDSKQFGRLWLGQGDTASNDSAQVDLSGTTVIAYSNSPDEFSGGVKFRNPTTGAFGPAVKSVFSNFDGLSRDDRIRYDTPKLANFMLSASHISGGAYDVALRHKAKFGPFKTSAAIAFADPSSNSTTIENRLSGSASVRHDSGFSLTFAAGRDKPERGGPDPKFVYGKLGYATRIFDIGETAFAIDFAHAEDIAMSGDRAISYGAGLVQNLKAWNTQFYAGIRNHELDRTGANFDDVFSLLAGARVKF